MFDIRRWRAAAAAATSAAVLVGLVLVATVAQAAAGCRVAYAVPNQWQGGFGASVNITNLGDTVNDWRLTWSFTAGQTVTQLWGGTVSQSGGQVTVVNVAYNATIPTNGSVGFGFNGSWNNTTNPSPSSFALNGVTCTGSVSGTTAPPGTTAPATTGPPASTPPATTGPPGTPPAAYPNPGRVTGSTGAHDPSVAKAPSGTYIVVTTGDNLPIKTSTDRVAFQNAGLVFPSGAPWTTTYTAGGRNLWAPDISYHNGQFYLYYSASTFGSQRSAIFLATSASGASGTWVDRGLVIESSGPVNYNAIDPNLLVDQQGQWWLSFGSFWTGIKLIRIDPASGKRSTSDTAIRALSQRSTAGGAVEAPFLYRHGGFYYLFVSFDRCCQGAQSTYRIMVGRSASVTGPYLDRNGTAMTSGGGTQILAGHGSIHGPGHQAVLSDVDGDVLFYHYYADNGAALLGINLLGWDGGGWPYVH